MANISIGGRISLLQRVASLDLRYGPYSSIADAYENMGPSGDEVITAGLPFGVTEDDGSVSVYIWTKGEDATQKDCKKLDKEHIVLFNGFIDISVSVKQQSYNDIATKSNIVFLSDRKQFAYRDGLNFYINWKNRYVWSSENLIPYDDVIYIDITTSKSYYFNGTTLVSLTYDIVVTSINNQSPDANGNVTLNKEDIGLENVDNTADTEKVVKGASEDGSGNVISTTYETKTDATTKQTTLQGAINALQTSVAALTGLDSTNFGGFSIQSTEADAISNIATLYTADGYTDELLWYMAGTSLSSVKAYRYNGSGTPTAISSDTYNCVDFSGLIADVSTLSQNLAALRLKVFDETLPIELPNGVSSESIGNHSAQDTSGTIWVDERAVIYPGQTVKSLAIQVEAVRNSARLNVYIVDTDFTNPILVASYNTLSSGKNEFFNVPINVDRTVYVGYEAVNFTFFFLSITPTENERTLHKVSTSGENLGVSYSLSSYYLTVENKELTLEGNIERIDDELNGETIAWNTGYLVNSINLYLNPSANFAYSSPIYLHKGREVFVYSGGNNVSFVTKSNENGDFFESVLKGISSDRYPYSYTVEEDGYYVLCYKYADSDASLTVDGVAADKIISDGIFRVVHSLKKRYYGGMYIYPFRTIARTDVFIFKDAVFTGLKPIENYEVFIPNSDVSFAKNLSARAIRFNASAGTSTLHLKARDIQGEICASKDVVVTVSSVPVAKVSQKARLNVFFFGDSIVAFNHNRIGVEFKRYLSTNDTGGTAEDGSIKPPAINICPSKINLVGEINLSDANFAYVFQIEQVFTQKRSVAYGSQNNTTYWQSHNPFYNPNSAQPDEVGGDGLNKRVDFVWYFQNSCPSGEYPDIIYMSVGANDIGTPDGWSGNMVQITAERLITVAKKMKSACDEIAGGTSDTKIKIFNHQSYPLYFAQYNNLPTEKARNIQRKYYDTIYSLIQSEGVSSYVELVDCASKFDIENGYNMGGINTNPRTTKANDIGMLNGDGIHMNMVGTYNYADCLIRDFLADSSYD